MRSFDYTITDAVGIHARPVVLLAKESQHYKSKITLVKGEIEIGLGRLIGLMSLGIKYGDNITVKIEGEDEEFAAEKMEEFFKRNL